MSQSLPLQLEELLDLALTLDGAERHAFLRGDKVPHELREELILLLDAALKPSPIDRQPSALADAVWIEQITPADAVTLVGKRLGRYRLIELLGEGGMASVWLADREEGDLRHQVAVKCLKTGLLAGEHRARFLQEQKILAQLQHPGIAQLHDAGVSEDGVPFIVMEYVKGAPITDYCRHHELSLVPRLRLFQKIVVAVAYAQQNLVVHRDIKPSNILVTTEGDPKLLDFGIAKWLDDACAFVTRTGSLMLTPEYAAPEQLRNDGFTTATDVFGLGAVLYELLTGCRATEGMDIQRPDTFVPRRPSSIPKRRENEKTKLLDTSKSDGKSSSEHIEFGRALRGDLDTIVVKALHPDAARRYPNALALGEDIERYLNRQPIQARKDSFLYIWKTFIRRHALTVAAITAVIFSLIASTVISLHQADLAREQSIRADGEAANAKAIHSFLLELFESAQSDKAKERELTVDDLLKMGADRVLNTYAGNERSKLDLLLALGGIQYNFGTYESAGELFEEAAALVDRVVEVDDPIWIHAKAGWAGCLLEQPNKDKDAADYIAEQIRRHRDAGAKETSELRLALGVLSVANQTIDKHDAAIAASAEALTVARRVSKFDFEFAISLHAEVLIRAGRHLEAEPFMMQGVDFARELHGEASSSYAESIALYAKLLNELKKNREYALWLAFESVEIIKKIYPRPTVELTGGLYEKGRGLVAAGRLDEAQAVYDELLQAGKVISSPTMATHRSALSGYGHIADARGDYAEAEKIYREALAFDETSPVPVLRRYFLRELGDVLRKQKKYVESRQVFNELLESVRGMTSINRRLEVEALRGLAKLEVDLVNYDQAINYLDEAWPLLEECFDARHPDRVEIYVLKAEILNLQSQYAQPYALLAPLLPHLTRLAKEEFDEPHLMASGWRELGVAQYGLGKIEDAIVSWKRAVPLYRLARAEDDAVELQYRIDQALPEPASMPARSP